MLKNDQALRSIANQIDFFGLQPEKFWSEDVALLHCINGLNSLNISIYFLEIIQITLTDALNDRNN